jgi:LuxR family maltose regulon positive regulatory protein
LAEPRGFARSLLDLGPPMLSLLQREVRVDSRGYAARLLARAAADDAKHGARRPARGVGVGILIEPLSERELEVLQLMTSAAKYQEMADSLFVSLNTVRTHTKAIYRKLGVNSRTAAVNRARELELL